jgi:hypothetical protein
MKLAKTIFMVLIMMLICCSYSIGQSSSGIGIKGNVGAAPIGIINNGASVYPVGEYGASVYSVSEYGGSYWLHEFVCNSMSACGMYDPARASDGAVVNLGGVKRVKP